jgi:hypothetical protein
MAFDADGSHAIVTNYFGNSYTVLRIDGAASHVVGTFARGVKPMRLDFDPVQTRTLIGNFESKTVTITNPETGALIGTRNYASYGNVIGVIADYAGEPVVLTSTGTTPPGYLIMGPDAVPLPAAPSYFDYCPARNVAVVTAPGPDWVSVIQSSAAGVPEVAHIPLGRTGALLPCQPNPVRERATLGYVLTVGADVVLEICDVTGRAVASIPSGHFAAGRHELNWTPPAAGAYFARLRLNGQEVDAQKLVVLE